MAWLIPTSRLVGLNNRTLQGTHDFVFAIGDWKPEPIGRTTLWGWIGRIDLSPDLHEDYLSDDFKLIKTSSVSRTVRPVCLSYRIALVPTLDPDTTHLYGNRHRPHDPSIINFDLLSHPVFNRLSRNVGRGYLSCPRLLILTSSTAVLSAITWTTAF
jgi:hypothetical protein